MSFSLFSNSRFQFWSALWHISVMCFHCLMLFLKFFGNNSIWHLTLILSYCSFSVKLVFLNLKNKSGFRKAFITSENSFFCYFVWLVSWDFPALDWYPSLISSSLMSLSYYIFISLLAVSPGVLVLTIHRFLTCSSHLVLLTVGPLHSADILFINFKNIFIWLHQVLVVACGI